jgi:hypothetical protein
MTPRLTKAMADSAISDGADVEEKRVPRKVPKPTPRPPAPAIPIAPDRGPDIIALKAEISELKQALAAEKISHERRSQELTVLLQGLSENKPMRLQPIRDMDRNSPTYLLVTHYDFVPVSYRVKLDS